MQSGTWNPSKQSDYLRTSVLVKKFILSAWLILRSVHANYLQDTGMGLMEKRTIKCWLTSQSLVTVLFNQNEVNSRSPRTGSGLGRTTSYQYIAEYKLHYIGFTSAGRVLRTGPAATDRPMKSAMVANVTFILSIKGLTGRLVWKVFIWNIRVGIGILIQSGQLGWRRRHEGREATFIYFNFELNIE